MRKWHNSFATLGIASHTLLRVKACMAEVLCTPVNFYYWLTSFADILFGQNSFNVHCAYYFTVTIATTLLPLPPPASPPSQQYFSLVHPPRPIIILSASGVICLLPSFSSYSAFPLFLTELAYPVTQLARRQHPRIYHALEYLPCTGP